jgi:hypothetical protein
MSSPSLPGPRSFAALRRFAKPRPEVERCDMCSIELAPEHNHVLDIAVRRLLCCCDACAILFSHQESGKYRRVPRQLRLLDGFRMTDAQWDALLIPINLAFFSHRSSEDRVVALYPSPAGATESLLSLEAWQALVADNPELSTLEPDVEALLVNRVGEARDHYRVGVDECFKLVGLIRANWRGLSGGAEVWTEIGRFFAALKERARG